MLLLEISNHLPFLSAGAKAFVCDQCGAQFSKEDALETHRQTHTGELTSIPVLQLLHSVIAHGGEASPPHPLSARRYPVIPWGLVGGGWAGGILPPKNIALD